MNIGKTINNTEADFPINNGKIKNKLVLVTGKSGFGKTSLGRRFVRGFTKETISSIIIDYSSSFREKELLGIGKYTYYNIADIGFGIDLFKRYTVKIEDKLVKESIQQQADRICENIINAYKIRGENQKYLLRMAIESVLKSGNPSVDKMINVLKRHKSQSSKGLVYKLEPLCRVRKSRRTIDWKNIIDLGEATVFQFSDTNEPVKTLLIELLLSDLWEYVKKTRDNPDFMIVLDEIQNMSFSPMSFLGKLREFRKFHIGVVMTTQFIGESFKGDAKALLNQADTKIYFKPDSENINQVAKEIDNLHYKEWYDILENLDVGECVFCGSLEFAGKVKRQKVIVRVPEYKNIRL